MKTNTVNFDKGNKEKHVSNDKMLCNHNYRTKLKFLNAVYNYVHLEILMKLVFPPPKKINYTEKYQWKKSKVCPKLSSRRP